MTAFLTKGHTMSFLTPSVAGEHDALATFLEQQLAQVRVTALGLDDERARTPHAPSVLSILGLLAHVAQTTAGWLERLRVAPATVEMPELMALGERIGLPGYYSGGELPEASLTEVLASFDVVAATVRPVIEGADLEARVPVPDAPWFPKHLESWNARWVAHHLIAEVARHAGHADLVREALDGEIAYSLNASADGEQFDWEGYAE